LIGQAIDTLDIQHRTVMVESVGCSVLAYQYFHLDHVVAPHGRAPAVMAGIKRLRPDLVVFTVQGDGDALAIGLAELMYAAARGEPVTIFLVNNGIYGMTGGQMAPTTPSGMVTTTTPFGRDVQMTGQPIDACKLLATFERAAYVKRVVPPIAPVDTPRGTVYSAKGTLDARRAVENAFKVQLQGGFALVEVLSSCNVNWKMTVLESKRYVHEVMAKVFPPGTYRDSLGVESA
jgi:2-oxoglutarate ferredoxin oxidoreductase subunit beta